MTCVALTDGSGGWFNPDTSQRFEEDTFFDGKNRRSKATGEQWVHEVLYRTRLGNYVLQRWSQQDFGPWETYERISPERAVAWLIQNGYDLPPKSTEV
jgi:hypothetical protein